MSSCEGPSLAAGRGGNAGCHRGIQVTQAHTDLSVPLHRVHLTVTVQAALFDTTS